MISTTSFRPANQQKYHLKTTTRVNSSRYLHSAVMVNYSIQERCLVQLGIYTISGEEVAVVKQEVQSPGEYEIRIKDAIPSWFYVCRFQAGSYHERIFLRVVK